MKKVSILAIIMFFVAYSKCTFAIKVDSLYQANLPVHSQTMEERTQLLPKGLEQVLIKVSGSEQVLSNPVIQSNLKAAEKMMQEFSYAPLSSGNNKNYSLQMDFDPEAVNRLLQNANVPIWNNDRPLILVLLSYETEGQAPDFISNESANNIILGLKQNADQRGIPTIFPVMDVVDMSKISINDLTAMNVSHLEEFAKRYHSDALLIGRIIQNPAKGYISHWKLAEGKEQFEWHFDDNSLSIILSNVMNQVANQLASRYAVAMTNVTTRLTLKVSDMTESDDLMQLLTYLKQLNVVQDVQVVKVFGSEVTFDIHLRGSKEAFIKSISLEQKLIGKDNLENESVLNYQWNH